MTAPARSPADFMDDARWMRQALDLAAQGRFTSAPNPCVGCLVVRDGVVVGEGWHRCPGEPHAEVHALSAAGDRARGATLYVTLEPCAHHGRTPPCAEAVVQARPARVVAAMRDPNPRVQGRGFERLRAAGIAVDTGVLEAQARELNRGFVARMERGRPWVVAKLGMSLDARTALASGESRWITGEVARGDVQRLRAMSDAVITGVDTVLADDPEMNVRDPRWCERQPLRLVLDSRLRTPPQARLFGADGPVAVVTTAAAQAARRRALEAAGAEVLDGGTGARIDLPALLEQLATRGCNQVLVEAGATLIGAFAAAELVDEWVVYIAPRLLGSDARAAFALPAPERLAQAPRLQLHAVERLGDDVRLTYRRPPAMIGRGD